MTDNHVTCVNTPNGEFVMEQRNIGFEPSDGQWIASQYPELYWSSTGTLYERRHGGFLGVFDTRDAALAAIHAAPLSPVTDVPVRSIGRVSC